jgi:S1-C subfamily serine protease
VPADVQHGVRDMKHFLVVLSLLCCAVCHAQLSYDDELAVVVLRNHKGTHGGSAFFVSPTTLMTAAHCVQGQSYVHFRRGGKAHVCSVVWADNASDSALLQTDSYKSSVWLKGASTGVGGKVTIYGGFPAGMEPSTGVVQSTDYVCDRMIKSYATAIVRGGYSGGPVVDGVGRVVGILTNSDGLPFSRSKRGNAIFTAWENVPR